MGVANTIMALAEGVEVMHTTVLGIGERAGNTPMEETVMALLTMYGIDIGLDYSKLTPLANLVQKLSGIAVPTNRPIVGSSLYKIQSGIIAGWYRNCGEKYPTEVFPMHWNLVGQPHAEVAMGKGSGPDSVKIWLDYIGMSASENDVLKILAAVKSHSLKTKKLLSRDDFRKIAEDILGQRAAA